MGNMWNCIIFDTKIKDGEKLCTLKNKEGTITYFEDIPEEKFDYLLDDIEKKAKKEGKTANEYLDISMRKNIYSKYAEKFELKFHKHFDGEIYVGKWSRRDNTPTFWLEGAHNHDVIGKKIQIGAIRVPPGTKSFHMLPDDIPFKANVELKYNNSFIPKQNTSSFFPKNWDIKRVKEEIALVYDEMLKSGKSFPYDNNKFFHLDSTRRFEIQIEFDKLGNLTSAYPKIN